DGDGKVEDIALHDEFFETIKHGDRLPRPLANRKQKRPKLSNITLKLESYLANSRIIGIRTSDKS
ncbi:MAG: hypothetical protein L0G85_11335, partial [Kocuria sp.]|nr:hypothetical protein [Kocuria sp.]